jgi:hypothetical protein
MRIRHALRTRIGSDTLVRGSIPQCTQPANADSRGRVGMQIEAKAIGRAGRRRSDRARTGYGRLYRRFQVKTDDIAKFHTAPTIAPATPASHHARFSEKT